MIKGRQGSWGWEVRQGITSQRCVCAVRAGFPGLSSMNFYYASSFISTQLQSLHLYYASNFLLSKLVYADRSWIKRQNSKVKVSMGEEEKVKGAKPTHSFCSVKCFFLTFCHFKTHTFPAELKISTNDNVIVHRLWILLRSQNASFHWQWGSGANYSLRERLFLINWGPNYTCSISVESSNDDVAWPSL